MAEDYALGTTIDFKFTTRRFSSGAPFTLAGTPVISAYPDNSTTELTAGITLTADFDSRTGLNNVRVVASSGNGYAAGSAYDLVITTGTVDSVSVVGEVVGRFTIEKQSGLRPTTAGRTLDVSAGGEGGVDWANVGSPTTVLDLSGTKVKTATDVETDTADIQSRLPAALVSGRIDASVGAMAANVLTATAVNADALTAAKFAADVTTELQSGLATSAAVSTLQTSVDDLPTNAELATSQAAADDATLSAIAALSIPTANANADALLDRANGVETGLTPRQAMRLMSATTAGKLSGAATATNVIRNAVADSKDRITATVDADGNRSAITYDLT